MKKWTNFFTQKPSPEYEARVFVSVENELESLSKTAIPSFGRFAFLSGLFATVAVAFFILKRSNEKDIELLSFDASIDDEFLDDLELFEDLEILDALNSETGDLDS